MNEAFQHYPAKLSIDYPETSDRLTTAFRLILILPIFLVLVLLYDGGWSDGDPAERARYVGGMGIVFLPTLLMIVFRQKYPRWWFDWNLEFTRFGYRVASYLFLMRDEYPSTDEEQMVHIDFPYPDAKNALNQWLPLVKWFLAIPHYLVLAVLYIGVILSVIVSWFAILLTGNHPRGIFDFIVGVFRWTLRVQVYAFILTTDEYPPFALGE